MYCIRKREIIPEQKRGHYTRIVDLIRRYEAGEYKDLLTAEHMKLWYELEEVFRPTPPIESGIRYTWVLSGDEDFIIPKAWAPKVWEGIKVE